MIQREITINVPMKWSINTSQLAQRGRKEHHEWKYALFFVCFTMFVFALIWEVFVCNTMSVSATSIVDPIDPPRKERLVQESEPENVLTDEAVAALSESEKEVAEFLLREDGAGLTKAGAAAVMGCISHESAFYPDIENIADGGYGLLQWTFERRDDLFAYCEENGLDANSVSGQLQFFLYELEQTFSENNGYSYPVCETLRNSESVEDCLAMFFCHAEAGTNVQLGPTVLYGRRSTQEMFDNRLKTANYYVSLF